MFFVSIFLRCVGGECVTIEIDSHFCSNCLENIPSTEAKHKKNRCNNCFNCPSCNHTLSARGTTVQVPLPKKQQGDGGETGDDGTVEEKKVAKKMYYLACLACRWTSRDPGIPDQAVATGAWPELEVPHDIRFQKLVEHYQALVLQRKQEKQDGWRRKSQKQHKFPSLTDRSGLTVSSIRRQINWDKSGPQKIKVEEITKSEASADTEPLPDSLFTESVSFKQVTTVAQRLNQVAIQPSVVNQLYPQHKSLSIKKTLRCRTCQHNVMKPELNPSSIKYRIQLFAIYHVPEVRLDECSNLRQGQKCDIKIKVINPAIYDMKITLLNSEEVFEKYKNLFNAKVLLTGESFELMRQDDSLDFEEENLPVEKDPPDFIVSKKGHQAVCLFPITVNSDVKVGEEVKVPVTVQYTYTNTTNVAEKKEAQKMELQVTTIIALGRLQATV